MRQEPVPRSVQPRYRLVWLCCVSQGTFCSRARIHNCVLHLKSQREQDRPPRGAGPRDGWGGTPVCGPIPGCCGALQAHGHSSSPGRSAGCRGRVDGPVVSRRHRTSRRPSTGPHPRFCLQVARIGAGTGPEILCPPGPVSGAPLPGGACLGRVVACDSVNTTPRKALTASGAFPADLCYV